MDQNIWDELIPENTILFLGSGFSIEAENKSGENFLTASELAERLGRGLGYASDEKLSLRDVSDDFIPNKQRLLNQTLQPLMTARKISQDQMEIIRRRWRRVYTTNYDDVFELGKLKLEELSETISFGDAYKKPGKKVQIVHLHGYIHYCDNDTIDEQLVLTDRSYVRQLSKPRPWFDQFVDDVRFAQAVIFVGYSLADTPINALLVSSPALRDKTSFIVRDKPVGRYERKVSRYGTIRPISLSGFVKHLCELDARSPHRRQARFSAFEDISPTKDKKELTPATTVQVRNLLTFGRFDRTACAATWPKSVYLMPRESKVHEVISAFATTKTTLVHGRIGNGKSLFCELLNTSLSQSGWRCIRAKSAPVLTADDLKLLKITQRLVIFFDSLDDANQALTQMEDLRDDMRFVVEISTSTADVRANALGTTLIHPLFRADVNKLTSQDKENLEQILNLAGIRPNNFNQYFKNCFELRDFILRLYENDALGSTIINHAKPLWENAEVRRVMVSAFILKCLELNISPNLKREIIGEDPAAALESALDQFHGNVHDFFDFRDSSVEPFSSIVSQFLLSAFLAPKDILDWSLQTATITSRRKQDELSNAQMGARFREAAMVLSRVLSVTRLRELLNDLHDKDDRIRELYEQARLVPEINVEPLFWLQMAILNDVKEATLEQLEYSLENMRAAYQRADGIPNFRTYQIDTYYTRLLLHIETHKDSLGREFRFWSEITKFLKVLQNMLSNQSHRDFSIRVLEEVEPFVELRVDQISDKQKKELSDICHNLSSALENLPLPIKVSSSSEGVRLSILRAAHMLDRKLLS